MAVLFSEAFMVSLIKYRSLKKVIQKKVDLIMANPLPFGEPLKGHFRGYYSTAVKKNFLIIYLYCMSCRKKKDQDIVLCPDCRDCGDDTLKFIDLGPHDQVYLRT
jgi:mRNA-degrading endonuclease YafQ of YafQ-DinJ toxin-antitoxin module